MMIKASDAIAKVLAANNIKFGFELIGGMIAHLVDSINQLGETRLISMHHEQGAAFAAGGVSRASNHHGMGLALGTSGPGATNLITGITDCWLDSHPCLFLTGQVNTYEQKNGAAVRQQGFQELDIVTIVDSVTKYACKIQTIEEIIPCLQKAIDIAIEGRPGPVLLDIPMDLQRKELNEKELRYLDDFIVKKNNECLPYDTFQSVMEELEVAEKPLFLIGGGAVNSKSFKKWLKYLIVNNIPYVSSLKGSEKTTSSKNYYGLIGAYGTRTANYAIQNCGLLIVVGSRMDIRQTGVNTDEFANKARVIQIDVDKSQLNNRVICDNVIHASSELFFKCFLNSKVTFKKDIAIWGECLKTHFMSTCVDEYSDWVISPFQLFSSLNKLFNHEKMQYVVDVGNNQMWAAHTLRLTEKQAAHYSGGLGTMGFAIPTSIGVYCVTTEMVVVIVGDGGAQLNIQELDIIAREQLPILVIVLNNSSLGMVRGFQEMYFDGRNTSTYWQGYSSKFKEIGEAYNLESVAIDDLSKFTEIIEKFKSNPKPFLLEVLMPDARECRPRLEFGNSIDEQSPAVSL
ncbi:Acetolactate synthase large subunit [hydrothermal vent metagenome]|uniref:Acetolactate synthase large subunit n=1 Tax=hydrothermal vent metagenome TaxID=652676 RepID=A0A3B0X9V8_9ZZZZ